MSTESPEGSREASSPDQARRPFAAKYAHRGWGIALVIIGAAAFFGSFGTMGSSAGEGVTSLIIGLGLAAWGVYLLRGQGVNPAAGRSARPAAGASAAPVSTAPLIGRLSTLRPVGKKVRRGPVLEVFQDTVALGDERYAVDASTSGEVYLDGSVQVGQALNRSRTKLIVDAKHDLRTAAVQFVGSSWSLSAPIAPDNANEARRIVAQLAAYVRTLQPTAASSADIQKLVDSSSADTRKLLDAITTNTGQPQAERLQQLSNLRFDRLISDDEFEAAKAKILGIA